VQIENVCYCSFIVLLYFWGIELNRDFYIHVFFSFLIDRHVSVITAG